MTFHSHGKAQACDTRCPSYPTGVLLDYVRTYTRDEVEYVCGVFCNVRGPLITARGDITIADLTCPNCLMILGERA